MKKHAHIADDIVFLSDEIKQIAQDLNEQSNQYTVSDNPSCQQSDDLYENHLREDVPRMVLMIVECAGRISESIALIEIQDVEDIFESCIVMTNKDKN